MMREIGGLLALGLTAACFPAGDFACDHSAQCSRAFRGVCQPDGRCSYPDDDCESGQRYSDLAGEMSGTCVPPAPEPTDEMPPPVPPPVPPCTGVECSGAGTCVVVDDQPTCACDPGLYMVGLQCLEDPCDTVTCHFVDAEQGDDEADGSRHAPWRTLERLEQALAQATPGDHFLLRRGQQWAATLELEAVTGDLDAPVVIGAYGPRDEPKPHLFPGQVTLADSRHVVVRDLWIEEDLDVDPIPNRACVSIRDSSHVMVWANTLLRCANRGVRINDRTAFLVLADNIVREVQQWEGLFVSDISWTDPKQRIGAHHWIIDNTISAVANDGIAVFTVDPIGDIKVVGNVITDTRDHGIRITAPWAWAVGNTVVRAGDTTGSALLFESDGPVSGNTLLYARAGLNIRGIGSVTHNTIIQAGNRPALEVDPSAREQVVTDNLVLAHGEIPWVSLTSDPSEIVAHMERNWYATEGDAPCLMDIMGTALDFTAFTEQTGFDTHSVCAPVPGLGAALPDGPADSWDEAFWSTLVPPADWSRCSDPAGARDCQGVALGDRLEPIDGYSENEGYGWAGPLLVRQRYPTGP